MAYKTGEDILRIRDKILYFIMKKLFLVEHGRYLAPGSQETDAGCNNEVCNKVTNAGELRVFAHPRR